MDKVTFSAQHERWWAIKQQAVLAPNTIAQYENVGRLHVVAELGSHRIVQMKRIDFDEWVARLVSKGLSASTIRTAHTIAGGVMESAVDAGIVQSNPSRGLRILREPSNPKDALTAVQVESLAAHMPEHYRTLTLVFAYGGLRPSEAFALRCRHFDDFDQLTIEEGLTETRGVLIERPMTKTYKRRVIPLAGSVTESVKAHIAALPGSDPEARIFSTKNGKGIRISNFRRDMATARDAAKLPGWVTPYTLRHTTASLLAHTGVGVPAASAVMGHDPAVYLRTYAHLYPNDLRSAAGALDRPRTADPGTGVHGEALDKVPQEA